MAVQEHDYFAFHAGNGVSGVSRPQASAKPTKEAARSGGGFKPFAQGIILGTVLLIPAGVWYWVQMGAEETAAAEETTPAHPVKANKAGAPYGYKRKPVKVVKAPVPLKTEESNRQSGPLVVTEPPPVVAVPVPAASPLVQIPKVPSESETLLPEKPKKNIWHKLAAPFRGKSPNNNEPPAPDGGE